MSVIAVDFDGTIVTHRYPSIGEEVPGAIRTMKELQANGHRLILLTMRGADELTAAVRYCRDRGVEFWAVNENPGQKLWTSSPKVYASVYIDDAALGCPLEYPETGRPYVDWDRVRRFLVLMNYLPKVEDERTDIPS